MSTQDDDGNTLLDESFERLEVVHILPHVLVDGGKGLDLN